MRTSTRARLRPRVIRARSFARSCRRHLAALAPAVALLALAACARSADDAKAADAPRVVVRGAMASGAGAPVAEDGQWAMASKDYANTRYSGLTEITPANAARLQLKWTFSTGRLRGHEAAPLVVGSTMYYVTPFPNQLWALDLAQPGGPVKWKYNPPLLTAAQGVACCDLVNRGAVYDAGKIYFATLDGQVVAVNAETGEEVWRVRIAEINRGETITMAPIVVKGKVMVGNSGGEMGVRGWLTALDAGSGKIAWRAYNTGPDKDVLIGAGFKPFYASDRGKDLGVHTWQPGGWQTGGGSVWGWLAYDPQLDLLYHGTGNPGPWNASARPGDNKWTSGIFARDPDDGSAKWFYQWSPHDVYDYDGINEQLLVDLPIGGQARKVLLRAERNGYFYVMDRTTGQVLSATPFVHITTSTGVDLKTGRLQYVEAKHPGIGKVVRDICPAAPGGKDWQPMSFSPRTGLVYIPHQNLCMDLEETEANYIAGTPYVGANVRMYGGPGGYRGVVAAWDPVNARKVWEIRENFPVWSGTVVTAGDVVFYGTMDRWFKAVDARTGKLLWQTRVGSGIIGQPISYRGPDGRQYVAIAAGVGGWSGAIVAGDLTPRDSTAALGFVGAMGDLGQHTDKGGEIYVFGLP